MKLSVVIATYNGEKYIEAQLKSILHQTVQPDEIVVCDDSSQDSTVKRVHDLLEEVPIDSKIIRHKTNQGVVSSFQDAITAATGDILFLSDQDDVWCKKKLEIFRAVFQQNDSCILAFSNAVITDDTLNPTGKSLWESLHFHPEKMPNGTKSAYLNEMLKRNIFTGMCMAFKKELVKEGVCFPEHMLHDEYLGWLALTKGKILPIQERLVMYRQHPDNLVGSSDIRKFQSMKLMKYYVRKSSTTTCRKFRELMEWMEDDSVTSFIENAYEFYKLRVQIFEMKPVLALRQILVSIQRGDYETYTSKSERAVIKDLMCIVF